MDNIEYIHKLLMLTDTFIKRNSCFIHRFSKKEWLLFDFNPLIQLLLVIIIHNSGWFLDDDQVYIGFHFVFWSDFSFVFIFFCFYLLLAIPFSIFYHLSSYNGMEQNNLFSPIQSNMLYILYRFYSYCRNIV